MRPIIKQNKNNRIKAEDCAGVFFAVASIQLADPLEEVQHKGMSFCRTESVLVDDPHKDRHEPILLKMRLRMK
jgi:hypothetical protein